MLHNVALASHSLSKTPVDWVISATAACFVTGDISACPQKWQCLPGWVTTKKKRSSNRFWLCQQWVTVTQRSTNVLRLLLVWTAACFPHPDVHLASRTRETFSETLLLASSSTSTWSRCTRWRRWCWRRTSCSTACALTSFPNSQ